MKPTDSRTCAEGTNPALPAVSELLILPDGRVMAHNLTPDFVALLSELNPDAPQFRPRRELAEAELSAFSLQPSTFNLSP